MMEPPSEEKVVKVEQERRRGIVKMDSIEVHVFVTLFWVTFCDTFLVALFVTLS